MSVNTILDQLENSIYLFQILVGIWGIYWVILIFRQAKRRVYATEAQKEAFQETIRTFMESGDYDSAVQFCEDPQHAYRAIPILARYAILKRHLPRTALREVLAAKMERIVIGPLEKGRAAVNTVAKSEPMLGLLGTVGGMIGAFGKIGGGESVEPQALAGDISLALTATGLGLAIAIPMVLFSNVIEVRIRELEDNTVEGLQTVLDDLEASAN
jgi:biopolymer transport protein ExbB/TolQ